MLTFADLFLSVAHVASRRHRWVCKPLPPLSLRCLDLRFEAKQRDSNRKTLSNKLSNLVTVGRVLTLPTCFRPAKGLHAGWWSCMGVKRLPSGMGSHVCALPGCSVVMWHKVISEESQCLQNPFMTTGKREMERKII